MKSLSSKFEEVKLVYHNREKAENRPRVTSPFDAFKIFRDSWDMSQINLIEECKLLLLDNQMRLMSIAHISKGGMTETLIDPRVVFAIALKRRAHRIILAHNHPTGVLNPSKGDIEITNNIMRLGQMMRISLDDHLIITPDSFCSIIHDGHVDIAPRP